MHRLRSITTVAALCALAAPALADEPGVIRAHGPQQDLRVLDADLPDARVRPARGASARQAASLVFRIDGPHRTVQLAREDGRPVVLAHGDPRDVTEVASHLTGVVVVRSEAPWCGPTGCVVAHLGGGDRCDWYPAQRSVLLSDDLPESAIASLCDAGVSVLGLGLDVGPSRYTVPGALDLMPVPPPPGTIIREPRDGPRDPRPRR